MRRPAWCFPVAPELDLERVEVPDLPELHLRDIASVGSVLLCFNNDAGFSRGWLRFSRVIEMRAYPQDSEMGNGPKMALADGECVADVIY